MYFGGVVCSRFGWWRIFALLAALFCPFSSLSQDRSLGASVVVDEALDDEDADSPVVGSAARPGPDPLPVTPKPVVDAPVVATTETDSLRWEIPPIPWRASISLSGGSTLPAEGSSSTMFSQNFSASGGSYVWQPWFLKLNGAMSISQSQDRSNESSGGSSSGSVGGGGTLLPSTRYPFSFNGSFAKSGAESRGDVGGGVYSESQTSALGLMQIYSPADGAYSSTWTYNRLGSEGKSTSDVGAQNSLSVVTQNMGVSLSIPLRTENPQSLTFSSDLRLTENQAVRASSEAGSVNAAHSIYLEDYVMTVSTNVVANATRESVSGVGSRSAVSNLFSNMDWVPSDDYPLNIGGSLGVFNAKTGTGAGEFNVLSTNATGTARYPLDKYWTFQGQFNLGQTSSEGSGVKTDNTSYTVFGSVNWSGEGVRSKWQTWDYSLGYGAQSGFNYLGIKGSSGVSSSQSNFSAGLSVNQGLTRGYIVPDGPPVLVSIGQGYSLSAAGQSGETFQSLDHSVSATWSPSTPSARRQFSVALSDGRSFGSSNQSYQKLSGSALYQAEVSPYSTLSGNGGVDYSQQGGSGSARKVLGANAGASYSHARFAGISGLTYDARYSLVVRQADFADEAYSLEHLVSQGWSWRYGLLGWRVDHTLSKFGNKSGVSQSIYLSVVRDFSGVL